MPVENLSPAEPTVAEPTLTPSPTLGDQIVVLTNEPHNIVMTAINLQLENNEATLTAAANELATLQAESHLLETQVAQASTQAASTSSSGSSTSSGGNQGSSKYDLPANVYPIVAVEKAYIFVGDKKNDKGAPIMEHYEPRVVFPPGFEAWVYKDPVKADGGTIYYESYDPDGDPPPFKIYFKANQIQVRPPWGKPNPQNYPSNVAKAVLVDKAVINYAISYDAQGKPVMEPYKPYIRYEAGQHVIVYPEYVIASGGSRWLPVYDPDGKPSGYLWLNWLDFPTIWE